MQFSELSLDQRQALASHPQRRIRETARAVFARGGVLPSADRQKVLEELLPLTSKKGDPVAGKLVYKNQLRQVSCPQR